jgi:hypothetical protein
MRVVLTILCVGLFSSLCFSATIYVPDNYPTIQDAINASVNGDTIIVRPGTYVENIYFLGKAITVTSEKGSEVTIIDGNQAESVVNFFRGEGLDSVLDGFTVTNGDGGGGGIYCERSSPTITNNVITLNTAINGGGILCIQGSPSIMNNNIISNTTTGSGGGIFLLSTDKTICTNNVIASNTAAFYGGGIISLLNYQNITNNTICSNVAGVYGGGIACTVPHFMDIKNTILWDNNASVGPEVYFSGTVTISHSDVYGGRSSFHGATGAALNWGSGMIDADPLFAQPTSDDFHLTWPSPCHNAGDNTAVTDLFDFEGDPRIVGTVDMGADEFYYHLYSTGDVLPGSPINIKVVGAPGFPAFLGLGTGIQDPPQSTPHGDLWLKMPLAKSWQLGAIPWTGILSITKNVPSGWPSGSQHPFQALIGTWGGTATLTNLMTLRVE